MTKAEAENIIKELKPECEKQAFDQVVPEFSYSVNDSQVVIRVKVIIGAENYELYQSETPREKYT